MAGYSDALDKQAELVRYWLSDAGLERSETLRTYMVKRDGAAASPEHFVESMIHELTSGEAYYVIPELCDFLRLAAAQLPIGTPLWPDCLPEQAGWVYFGKAIPVPPGPGEEHQHVTVNGMWQLRGMSWECLEVVRAGAKPTGQLRHVSLTWYVEHPDLQMLDALSSAIWPFGDPWDRWVALGKDLREVGSKERDALRSNGEAIRGLTLALFLFLQQQILVTERERPDRATRRRLSDIGQGDPTVRVVRLRRLVPRGRERSEHEPVNWSCSWLVRGHWRQQYFPSRRGHAPLWIAPYPKGNPDKPLKVPRATVFAVVR